MGIQNSIGATPIRARWISVILAAGLLMTPVLGHANAGKVLFALGDVNVDREELIPAKRGMPVLEGDTVITGAKGRAQLKMNDGGKISVRPSSEFKVETFTMEEPAAEAAAEEVKALGRVTDDGDTAVYKLLKGGFRTVTGVVGKREGDTYKVETPVATIGIRGTDYTVVLCEADCGSQGGTDGSERGVFVGVSSGHVVLTNTLGEINLFANETGFVAFGTAPVILDVPVPPIFEDLPPPPSSESESDEETSEPSATEQRVAARRSPAPATSNESPAASNAEVPTVAQDGDTVVDLTDGDTEAVSEEISIAYAGPVSGFFSTTQVERQPADQVALDASGNLNGFGDPATASQVSEGSAGQLLVGSSSEQSASIGGVTSVQIGSAEQFNTGFDPLTALRWGRWSGGEMDVAYSDGFVDTVDLSAASLHWVISPNFDQAVVPTTGTADYVLVGNTDPTDLSGNVGSLGSANFAADFTNATVSNEIRLSMAGELWVASGNGVIGGSAPNHFAGSYDTVSVGQASGNGSGNFTGLFAPVSDTTNPIPQGAGLTYSIQDEFGDAQITGAAVFGNPE